MNARCYENELRLEIFIRYPNETIPRQILSLTADVIITAFFFVREIV